MSNKQRLFVTLNGLGGLKSSIFSYNNRELILHCSNYPCCTGPGAGRALNIHKEKLEPADVIVLFKV